MVDEKKKPQEKDETKQPEPSHETTPQPDTANEESKPEEQQTSEPLPPPEPTPSEDQKDETPTDKTEPTTTEELPKKQKKSVKEIKTKKTEEKDDFRYIVRIADTDIDGEKQLIHGLTQIKGIGRHLSAFLVDKTGINRHTKVGNLTDQQIEQIKETLSTINEIAPSWMLNHQKDYDTGNNIHLISTQIDLRLRDDINKLKMIRSYRGIRHETGLKARGQRTRANGRKGLSLGVSKKKP